MLKKPFALGLIAVGLIITPSTALADMVIQRNQQSTVRRDSPAVSESVNKQRSESISIRGRYRNSRRLGTSLPRFCLPYRTKQHGTKQLNPNVVKTRSGIYVSNLPSKGKNTITQRQVRKTHAALCRKLPQ
ncbi:hypothetical protein [Mastigocoleus sp. MO_188.B34]|uniref:hypothetical protein n=1 Tax=Mastigocoleus sp. MO_188.B34 TaxID=3036635 RepID=UPI002619B082|nr:hypothetical protein [Mastigocoleus sp. MO_188.B34]MDJ0697017.1 hypothetical protein [Mastigocoleus sp. MO_188.B34]